MTLPNEEGAPPRTPTSNPADDVSTDRDFSRLPVDVDAIVARKRPDDYGPPAFCLVHDDVPAVWTSPTGHHFCQQCRETVSTLNLEGRRFEPVDLDELLSGNPPAEDWYVDPLLPRGKLTGIGSLPAHGKSLLLFDIACKKATGEKILEQAAGPPEHVIYLDMEMGPDDLYDRLTSLGYTRDHPLWATLREHLHYYQLIALPPLNTEEGGQALEDMVDYHSATFIVIDTLARVILGRENDSDPYQDLFRFTETMLKRRAITLARLDHLGKDPTKGMRGASAKTDGLDVVWQMEQALGATMQFKRTKGRQPWVPEHVTVHRVVDDGGTVSHNTEVSAVSQETIDLAYELDVIGVPIDAGTPTAQRMLKEAGKGRRRIQVRLAVKYRKTQREKSGPPADHPLATIAGPRGTTIKESQQRLGDMDGTTPRTTPDQSRGVVPSLKEGPPLDRGTLAELLDKDFEPDPDFEPDLEDFDFAEANLALSGVAFGIEELHE